MMDWTPEGGPQRVAQLIADGLSPADALHVEMVLGPKPRRGVDWPFWILVGTFVAVAITGLIFGEPT